MQPEPPEDKKDKSPVHVYLDTLDAIQKEQKRLQRTEGKGKPSAAEVVGRAWQAYERAKNVAELTTKGNVVNNSGMEHSEGEAIKILASEISERASALLRIAEKVRPTIGIDTTIPHAQIDSRSDLDEITGRLTTDTARISADTSRIEEQSGIPKPSRKTAYPKVSNG